MEESVKEKGYIKTLKSFLVRQDYIKLSFLLSLILLTSLIELIGVGSLFPYIKLLENPAMVHQSHLLSSIYNGFNFSTDQSFELFIGGMIFLLVLLKGIMSTVNNYTQTRYSKDLSLRLSKNCLTSYFKMPYIRLMNENSASLSKHVIMDIDYVVQVFVSVLSIVTDCLVTMALIALMLWVDFKLISTVTIVLALVMLGTIRLTRGSLQRVGRENESVYRYVYKNINCSLQGVKDIRTYQAESYFTERFLYWKSKLLKNQITYAVVSNLPAITMNIVGFGALLLIMLYLLYQSGSLISSLPTIGIIAVAIQRLLPAATRMSTSLGTIRQYKPNVYVIRDAVDKLKEYEKEEKKNLLGEKVTFKNTLRFENIRFNYPSRDKIVLSNISLLIKKNQSIGIVGSSGSGKSTLIDVLLGLLPVDDGKIYCDDVDITHVKGALFHLTGYVPQQPFLLDGTIKENIAFGISDDDVDIKTLLDVIEVAQLKELVDELPDGINTIIGEKGVKFSGGQRQRIGIARALYTNPQILIMDEATSSLDSVTEKKINMALDTIQKNKTLIIIAHRLTSVKFCKSIAVIKDGCLVSNGTHKTLSESCSVYNDLYKENLRKEALVT